MKITALPFLLVAASATPLETRASGVQGFDISSYQGTVDFAGAYSSGARFVMIKVNKCSNRHRMYDHTNQIGDRGHHIHGQDVLQSL
jgi:GH25 family lysozyme M1 (1,4-beta-N-acetylmuramidase)